MKMKMNDAVSVPVSMEVRAELARTSRWTCRSDPAG
jgi:hypothetical protein